eukprot:scaffold208806_cov17-Prasinocladus_malaysianus.AAC.1
MSRKQHLAAKLRKAVRCYNSSSNASVLKQCQEMQEATGEGLAGGGTKTLMPSSVQKRSSP